MKEVLIYGAGGFAREVAWLVSEIGAQSKGLAPVAYIDDEVSNHGSTINGLPVVGRDEALVSHPEASVAIAIGSPAVRQKIAETITGREFCTLLDPAVRASEFVEYGEGAIVCAGNILTVNIDVGRHVHINLDCTVGHDVRLGSFSTLSPGVHVSGWVHLAERVYVGTGATIVNGTASAPLTIASDVVIGAGACVARSIDEPGTYVGIPARKLKR